MRKKTVVFESVWSDHYEDLFLDDTTDIKSDLEQGLISDIEESFREIIAIEDDEIVMRYKQSEIRVPKPFKSDINFEEVSVKVIEDNVEYVSVKVEDITCDTGVSHEYLSECEEKRCTVVKSSSYTLDVHFICSERIGVLNYENNFEMLIKAIYKADALLGRCFESNVKYRGFYPSYGIGEYDFLVWEARVDDPCKRILMHGYSVIRPLVKKSFTQNTNILAFREGMSTPLYKKKGIEYEVIKR